jgi:hypothetical protein
MVIERKLLVWPQDYPQNHKNDHFLAQTVTEALKLECNSDLYSLVLECSLQGHQAELKRIADEIIRHVKQELEQVRTGKTINSLTEGRRWTFRLQNALERHCHPLKQGIVVFWYPGADMFASLGPESVATQLQEQTRKIFRSCERKFAAYSGARKVLLLDPQGELRHAPREWFNQLFRLCPPPKVIDSIWSGIFEWLTDQDEGWIFEKLYPTQSA